MCRWQKPSPKSRPPEAWPVLRLRSVLPSSGRTTEQIAQRLLPKQGWRPALPMLWPMVDQEQHRQKTAGEPIQPLDTRSCDRHRWSMVTRCVAACIATLGLLLLADPSASRDSASPAVRDWLSAFITKIDEADRARSSRAGREPPGTVVVHVEVGADGLVRQAQIERGSGSATLDRRALDAVRAVSPFTAPPAELLTEAGVTNLSFPLRLGR